MTATSRRGALGALLALPGAAALSLGAGCTSPAAIAPPDGAEPVTPPMPRVGDRWRYRLIDRYNGGSMGAAAVEVAATSPEIVLHVDRDRGLPRTIERYSAAWTVVEDGGWDAPVVFETPMPMVPAGARTGLSLRATTRYRSPFASTPLRWEQVLRVGGWERIEVPAGRFDAMRVQRSVYFQHPDIFRLGPEREETLWYAPAVGRWVAREWTGDYMPGSPTPRFSRAREDWVRWELTAYEPAGR